MSEEALSQLEYYKTEDKMLGEAYGKLTKPNVISVPITSNTFRATRKDGQKRLEENDDEEEDQSSSDFESQPSTFKLNDYFFDTLTAAKCFQNDNVDALSSRIKCDDCGMYINQSDAKNLQLDHFSKEAIKCPDAKCMVVSYCRIFVDSHINYHKHLDNNNVSTPLTFSDQLPTKEDLMICTNCKLYFDIFQKQSKLFNLF